MKSTILEDGKEYIILDEIINNNIKYIYLAEIGNESNFIIRKEIQENGKCYFIGLKGEEEYKIALNLYIQKNA